ncbi:MAG: DNA repair protein RecO [Rothia sp. (in: high G+C Gram-positive bacteria)]|nr:DNA repair protein RecO [Rothia sp. (in: high G+C Gram-positive bacteria)]
MMSTTKAIGDSAIVLRTQDLGEHDRIIILATRQHGVVHAVARGVRKSSSKIGARLEPFMLVDISAVPGKNLATISQVVTRRAYLGPIVSDYTRYTVATVVAEVAEQLLNHEQERLEEQFTLLAGALSALARGVYPPHRVLDSYLLRALHRAGWSMAIGACAVCGVLDELTYFSPALGVVCTGCARGGEFPRLSPLAPAEPAYLAALARGDWARILAEQSSALLQRAERHIIDYVQWQLERPLKTLSTLEKEI